MKQPCAFDAATRRLVKCHRDEYSQIGHLGSNAKSAATSLPKATRLRRSPQIRKMVLDSSGSSDGERRMTVGKSAVMEIARPFWRGK